MIRGVALERRLLALRLKQSRYCAIHRCIKHPVKGNRRYFYCRSCITERIKNYHLSKQRSREAGVRSGLTVGWRSPLSG